MDAYLRMNARDRRLACLAVADAKRLQAASVDKDFWVCWTLREVFNLPHIGKHLTFKGGTSLSKAWGLIERFSEDIDIVVDKDILGFTGDASPDKAPSNKQRRRRLDDLMEACRRRFPMRRFLFPHYCRNAPSGKKPCCCTKKPFVRQTSRAKNAWRVTTMTHGVLSHAAWPIAPPQTAHFLPASRNIARFSFASAGLITPHCNPAACD